MNKNNSNIDLEPQKWYSLSFFTKKFKINYYFLKKAVEENKLFAVKFGNTTKTTGAEYIRFTNELLYGNNEQKIKQAKRIKHLSGLNDFDFVPVRKIKRIVNEPKKGIV